MSPVTAAAAIRVLQDPPLDGPTNMARDEALLVGVGAGESPPTLRLYQWAPPTVSLGYFQRYADYESLPSPFNSLPVVRRLTGGGAILHDLELTYSVIVPINHRLVIGGPSGLYELVHDAVIASLATLGVASARSGRSDDSGPVRGPLFCFQRRHRYDVLIGDRKVAGSAQRRTREALLQHGSIILGDRHGQPCVASVPLRSEQAQKRLRCLIPEKLGHLSGQRLEPKAWSSTELNEAGALIRKYTSDDWTRRT